MTHRRTFLSAALLLVFGGCDSRELQPVDSPVPQPAPTTIPAPNPLPMTPLEPPPAAPVEADLVMAQDSITFHGKRTPFPSTRQAMIDALGAPDRELKLSNNILVWDELGVYAYVYPDRDIVHDVSFAVEAEDYAFIPKRKFSGTISVLGRKFSTRSALEEIKAAGFVADTILPGHYQFDFDPHGVRVEWDEKRDRMIAFHVTLLAR
jgi:hypothetical protein